MLDKAIFYSLVLFSLFSTVSMAGQTVFTSLALLFAVIKIVQDRKGLNVDGVNLKGFAVYFGSLALLTFFSTDIQESAVNFLNYFYRFSIFFVVLFFIKSRKQIEILIFTLILSITITDLYAIFEWINGEIRTSGFLSNPMILAGCLILLIPFALTQSYGSDTIRKRLFMGTSFILSCIALIANKTRGAWVAVACLPFIMLFVNQHKRPIIYGIIAMILLGSVSYLYVPSFQARIASIFDLENESNAERLLLWQSSLEMVKDYPLTGVGPGEFADQYNAKYISPVAKMPGLAHAHNNFMHILAETGITGLVAFCYMFYTILRQHYLYIKFNNPWVSALASAGIFFTGMLLIQGVTEYNYGNSVVIRLFWFLTGLIYAAYRVADHDKNRQLDIY